MADKKSYLDKKIADARLFVKPPTFEYIVDCVNSALQSSIGTLQGDWTDSMAQFVGELYSEIRDTAKPQLTFGLDGRVKIAVWLDTNYNEEEKQFDLIETLKYDFDGMEVSRAETQALDQIIAELKAVRDHWSSELDRSGEVWVTVWKEKK
jgi:hypothetical protein